MTADWAGLAPPFYQAFYHDSVQLVLNGATHVAGTKSKSGAKGDAAASAISLLAATVTGATTEGTTAVQVLEKLWKMLMAAATNADAAASAQLCVQSTGVSATNPRGGSLEIRYIVQYLLDGKGALVVASATSEGILRESNCLPPSSSDLSVSSARVDFEDFVDMFCRLAASDLWAPAVATSAAAATPPDEAVPAANADAAAITTDVPVSAAPAVEFSEEANGDGSAVPATDEIVQAAPLHELLAQRLSTFAATFVL